MKDDRAENIQHGESGFTTAESCHKDGPEDPDLERRGILQKSPHGHKWSVIEHTGHTGEWGSFRKVNGRSSNGQQPEPEEEGETRVRVAISSKMWFGVAARLNGQRLYL